MDNESDLQDQQSSQCFVLNRAGLAFCDHLFAFNERGWTLTAKEDLPVTCGGDKIHTGVYTGVWDFLLPINQDLLFQIALILFVDILNDRLPATRKEEAEIQIPVAYCSKQRNKQTKDKLL